MTMNQFLNALCNTPRNWQLNGDCIRLGPEDNAPCPITSLVPGSTTAKEANETLGIDHAKMCWIVHTADGAIWLPDLRKQLLVACSL